MNDFKFEISEPYTENWRLEICIDRIDFDEQQLDSKYILMDKTFCLFELPKLGVKNTQPIVSKTNLDAIEWLKLYAKKIFDRYVTSWEQQPETLRLMCGRTYPSLEELRAIL